VREALRSGSQGLTVSLALLSETAGIYGHAAGLATGCSATERTRTGTSACTGPLCPAGWQRARVGGALMHGLLHDRPQPIRLHAWQRSKRRWRAAALGDFVVVF